MVTGPPGYGTLTTALHKPHIPIAGLGTSHGSGSLVRDIEEYRHPNQRHLTPKRHASRERRHASPGRSRRQLPLTAREPRGRAGGEMITTITFGEGSEGREALPALATKGARRST